MKTTRNILMATFLLFLLSQGCYRMKLELVDASVQKPSNVALFFSMDDKSGEPVPGVEASQFKIYEDGKLISTYESKQTILNPEVATVRYTLLLLDMSGSVVDSGQIPLVQEAVGAFLEGIDENEKVAIYAFDGREKLVPVAKFGTREKTLEKKNELLSSWETKDPSTNLNGAIIEATKILQEAKEKSDVPLRFGTVVIFTDGTDRAHRATTEEAMEAINNSQNSSFVIGLGGEVSQQEMEKFGKDGFVHADDKEAVVDAFEKVADRINAHALRYYLLSYCSPARAGQHELTVEVELDDQKGKLAYTFDAEGFKPECDPTKTPAFKFPEDSTKSGYSSKKSEKKGISKSRTKAPSVSGF